MLPRRITTAELTAIPIPISISGKATTYPAVSNFYTNLTDSGFFTDVELGRTFEVQAGVSFSLSCTFSSQKVTDGPAEGQQG